MGVLWAFDDICDWQATALVDQPPIGFVGGHASQKKKWCSWKVFLTPFSNLNVPFMGIAWGFGGLMGVSPNLGMSAGVWLGFGSGI